MNNTDKAEPKRKDWVTIAGIVFLGWILFSAFSSTTVALADTDPEPPYELGSQWTYLQSKSEMSTDIYYYANVKSTNIVSFKFPYEGFQRAGLRVEKQSVTFAIGKGQIICAPLFTGCYVLVRFDDEVAGIYKAYGLKDGSTESIYFLDHNVRDKILQSKTVRIQPTIYQEGSPVFTFDVSGFDQKKMGGE